MKKSDILLAVNTELFPNGKTVTSVNPLVGKNLVDGVNADTIYFAEKIAAKGFGTGTSTLELRKGTDTEFEVVKSVDLTGGAEVEVTDVLFTHVVCDNVNAFFKGYAMPFGDITPQ